VLLDLSSTPYVDLQSAETLAGLADELAAAGIRLQAVEARASVRDRLRKDGVDAKLGGISRWVSVADAVEAFESAESRDPTPSPNPPS
jgi:MFS superfamily sulfate permease-like transporter